MGQMKTPGVYIVEKNAFPNSVVEVATAVPAFIGYTEKALNGNKSLTNQPMRISSMSEFHNYFGFAPTPMFGLAEAIQLKMSNLDTGIPSEFLLMAPYIVTLVVVAGFVGRSRAPKAAGQAYDASK